VSQVQQLPTSGIVKSRLGEIELKNGYPTEASVKKIYNDLDFQRSASSPPTPRRLTSWRFQNMKETGPLVVEIPPGATAGGILDFWQ
jgi:hypothetical protein